MARKSDPFNVQAMKFAAVALALVIGVVYAQTAFRSFNQGQLLGASTYLAKGGERPENSGRSEDRGRKTEDSQVSNFEQDQSQLEIRNRGERIKFDVEDNELKVKKQYQNGPETEVEMEDVQNEIDGVEVATDEANTIVFVKDRIGAHSKHPLSIDLATNELIVTTPAGVKRVTVLPQVAVLNMLRLRKIDDVIGGGGDEASDEGGLDEGGQTATDEAGTGDEVATDEGTLADTTPTVEVDEQNGEIVYEVEGTSNERLAGIAPVKIKKKLTISAQTGELINEQMSLLNRILDLLSVK